MTQRQAGNEVNATVLEDEPSKLHTPTFPDWLCEGSKKRQKKRKKKKGKHENTELFLPQADVYHQLEQSIHEKRAIRTASYFVPLQLVLSDRRESAFFFGRTIYNELAGKKSVDDGHIAVFGGSGSGKTTGIAIPTLHRHSIKFCVKAKPIRQKLGLQSKRSLGFPLDCFNPAS